MKKDNSAIVDFILNESFQRFVINKTPDDTQIWESWIEKHPEALDSFKESQKIISFIVSRKVLPKNKSISDEVYKKLLSQIEKETQQTIKLPVNRHLSYYWYAASVLLVAGLVFLFSYKNIFNTSFISQNLEIIVPKGQRSQLLLPDGTKVWLNSGTIFKYPTNFLKKGREVYLEGEAFFNVTHNNQPFIVHLKDNLFVKVFGTEFNVKSYTDDKIVETTLIRGIVNFVRKDENNHIVDEIKLAPKEKVIYEKSFQKMTVTKLETSLSVNNTQSSVQIQDKKSVDKQVKEPDATNPIDVTIAWKDNTLAFQDQTLEEIAVQMERWFGMQIIIQDEDLKRVRFTGTFNNQESIYQILDIINRTEPIQYTRQSKTILISKKKNIHGN